MPEQCPFVNASVPPCDPVEVTIDEHPAYCCRVCGKVTHFPEAEKKEDGQPPILLGILLSVVVVILLL